MRRVKILLGHLQINQQSRIDPIDKLEVFPDIV
jgi:hypothetical protein